MRSEKVRKKFWCFFLTLLTAHFLASSLVAAEREMDEQVRKIASELRCVVCQNLSVADSPAEMAVQWRGLIREQLEAGRTPAEIKAYFVSRYGEFVLLAPTRSGFNLLVWLLPFAVAGAGLVVALLLVRRWSRKRPGKQPSVIDPGLIERVQRETAGEGVAEVDLEDDDPRAPLARERARLYNELREFEFDYHAGKLSEADYRDLRRRLEAQAATVLKALESSGPRTPPRRPSPPVAARALPGWRLSAGAAFLLLFGISIGVFLSQSVRPRGSETDLITGDFLTGTSPRLPQLLAQGRSAFEREAWGEAIESFKQALAIDPGHPEAHSYMGLILTRAGHADGALLAFDRALSSDPNFPLALWGKGMALYHEKGDLGAARQTFQKLLAQIPPGPEQDAIQNTLAEIARSADKQKDPGEKTQGPGDAGARIQGTISIDKRLKDKVDPKAVLFIIARPAGAAGGPPLAVVKVENPTFPFSYTIGPENVMMSGLPFAGKVLISARLDRDGNAVTREEGNLTGEFKKNPAEVGSRNIDIVLDQAM